MSMYDKYILGQDRSISAKLGTVRVESLQAERSMDASQVGIVQER